MLFLVTPTFFSNFLSQLYATINSVESNVAGTMGTVLEQGKLNDEIIKIFKKIFPNPNIVFKRLKETEIYTISLEKQSDIDFAELEKKHVINSSLHNNLTNPALTVSFNDRYTGAYSTMGINKILFNLSKTMPNYTPFTDKELYENGGAKIQEMIQNGKKLSGIKLNNLNINNTNYPGVSFSGSDDMNDSQFVNAKLIGADFADAQLSNANFNNADLRGSDFSVATITGKALFIGADLKFSNFSGADLTGADLTDADLRHANLSGVTLTDCIINENTKIYGATLDDDNLNDNLNEANMRQYEDDTEYEASGVAYVLEEEEIDYSVEDELAVKAEEFKNTILKRGQSQAEDGAEEENKLPPLVIDKTAKINDRSGQTYTFENIVSLLTPKITNVKIPLSQMGLNKWYGIASLGNTSLSIWEQVGVNEPHIGTVFKSEAVPNPESGEAIVYETVATCMAVHELSRMLDINNLFKTFLDSVDSEVFSREFDRITRRDLMHEQEQLKNFAMMLYNLLLYLLSKHNEDETADSWTHIYDDIEKRKQFVSHAVFNSEEGIMYHPRFDYRLPNGIPEDILVLIMFIESLPPQVQVAWAQNYIKEFIEGYGQQLETFDRTKRSDMGFIASCLNGNLEKFLLTITPAIINFYPLELEEQTVDTTLKDLKSAVTGSVFEKYYKTVDVAGPTLEGYKNYIQTNPEFNNKEELRQKYLELLEDQTIIDKITETITIMSGGKKKRGMKCRKTIKRKTMKRKTMKRKTMKRKTMKRNNNKKKHKKTVRKNNKTYNHK